MSKRLPPAPPTHLPEAPEFHAPRRYQRPRRLLSWWGLFLGLLIGASIGLFYAWEVAPVTEFDTAPRQLNAAGKAHYAVAVALRYRENSNLNQAIDALVQLELGPDPIGEVANIACRLASSGYVESSAGLRGVRSLMNFYQLQGRVGCADTLLPNIEEEARVVEIVVPTSTPTLPPPPTKTETPAAEGNATPAGVFVVPTNPPRRQFEGRIAGTFCDAELSGIIEVFVQTWGGEGIPGEMVRVRWEDGEDLFVSGLKPERGSAFADFRMTAGRGYTIDMPGRSDPINQPLTAERCILEGGGEALRSYRVVFRQIG